MGVYRRKDKNGVYYGHWIIQYPTGIDPKTGKTKYTSVKISHNKRLAELAYGKQMLEWEKKKHLGLEKKKEHTFRELVNWYLTLPRVKEKKSYESDRGRADLLKEYFGLYPANEIKPGIIETYQHDLLSKTARKRNNKYSPATVNRLLALMKRIFSLAVREEMVLRNPCIKVSMLPENNERDRVITREEFDRIDKNLPDYAVPIVTTAYYTGMRAGEIMKLTWDKVNLKEGFIGLEAEDTKTAEPRKVYINGILRGIFSELAKVRHISHSRVFTCKGKPINNIRRSFLSACKSAGVENFRFHDLRHTFNTNMRKAGVDRSVIMKITGHKTIAMFERYNTVDGNDARDALRKLDDFLAIPAPEIVSTSGLLQE